MFNICFTINPVSTTLLLFDSTPSSKHLAMSSSRGSGDGFRLTNASLQLAGIGVCETWQCDIPEHSGVSTVGLAGGLMTGTGRRTMNWTMADGVIFSSDVAGRVWILRALRFGWHEELLCGFSTPDMLLDVWLAAGTAVTYQHRDHSFNQTKLNNQKQLFTYSSLGVTSTLSNTNVTSCTKTNRGKNITFSLRKN